MNRIAHIVISVFLAIAPCASQLRLPDAKMHALVLQGIDLTWQEQYGFADSIFRQIAWEFPEHPAGFLYQAGVVLARAMDNELEVDLIRFDSLIALGKKKANTLIESGSDPLWGYFFKGTADGSDSYARVYQGDWFGGTRKGFASVSAFKDATAVDSSLCDAYAGIGAFYYWRSRKTEFFNWIPFVGDDRDEGIALLTTTADKGIYNRSTALSMLVAIYTDAGQYNKAITCCRVGLRSYPRSRTFLWGLATALQKAELWQEAGAAYRQLLDVIVSSRDNNRYNETVCRLNLARVKTELQDTSEAVNQLKDIATLHESDFPRHLRSRAQDKLEQAAVMLRKLKGNQTSH